MGGGETYDVDKHFGENVCAVDGHTFSSPLVRVCVCPCVCHHPLPHHSNAADFKRTFDVKLRDKALDIMDRVLQAAVTGIATPMPSASMPPPPHRTASTPLATIHAMAGTKSVRQASRVAAAALSASAAEAISGNTDDDDSDADVDMGRSPPPPRHSGKRPRHSGKRPRITLSLGGKRPRSYV